MRRDGGADRRLGFRQVDADPPSRRPCARRRGRASRRVFGARRAGGRPAHAPRRARIRRHVGFVFQQFNLVGRLSVLTNVLIGLLGRIPLARHARLRFTEIEKRRRRWPRCTRVGIAEHCARQRAVHALRRPAAARRDRARPGAGRQADARRRADRLARSRVGAPRHGDRWPRSTASDGVTVLVSLHQVAVRHALLPAHHRAARRRGRLRRASDGADAGHAAASSTAPRAEELFLPDAIPWRAPARALGAAAAAAAL